MADVSAFRPGGIAPNVNNIQGQVQNTAVLEVTNQQTDANGDPVGVPQTTEIVNVQVDANNNVISTFLGDLGFSDVAGDSTTVIDVVPTPDSQDPSVINNLEIDAGFNSTFVGAANRLNIFNGTVNGGAPLDIIGRRNYNVLTVTEVDYEALEIAGTIDANTLYLIREVI